MQIGRLADRSLLDLRLQRGAECAAVKVRGG